jgi:long-chain acyl-CoA synthetase
LIKDCIDKVNRDLSQESHLANSQIRRFLILHKELDADDGELTRTLKVRRSFVADRYDSLINALYSDQSECHVCTEVIFEDGRSGMLEADVKISEAEFYPVKASSREAAA